MSDFRTYPVEVVFQIPATIHVNVYDSGETEISHTTSYQGLSYKLPYSIRRDPEEQAEQRALEMDREAKQEARIP